MTEDGVSITKSAVSWPIEALAASCEGIEGCQTLFGRTLEVGGTLFQYVLPIRAYDTRRLSRRVSLP
jgi:hypothetical protein